MAISKSEIQVRKARQVNITGSRYMFKKGDPVYLGADFDGNVELVPWDINVPRYIEGEATLDSLEGIDEGIFGEINDVYHAHNGKVGGNTTANLSWIYTHILNDGGNNFLFVIGHNPGSSGPGGQGTVAIVFEVSSQLSMNTAIDTFLLETGTTVTTASINAGYIGDDATYWYFWMTCFISGSSNFRLIRVVKTTRVISDTAERTDATATELQLCALDDTNEVAIFHYGTKFYTSTYSKSGWSTPGVLTERTIQYMMDNYNWPGMSVASLNMLFYDEDNNITWFLDSMANRMGADDRDFSSATVYRLDWDAGGTEKWTSFVLIKHGFSYVAHVYGFAHLGGGYFSNGVEDSITNGSLMYFPSDGSSPWFEGDIGRKPSEGSNNNEHNTFRAVATCVEGINASANSGKTSVIGAYLNNRMYWCGDTLDGSNWRPGWDPGYVYGATYNNAYGRGGVVTTFNRPYIQVILSEDSDYMYGLAISAKKTSSTLNWGYSFKVRKPRVKFSLGKIGIALSDSTQGARASIVLRGTANPADGETVTIDGKTYTFQTTLTDVDGNVHIEGTLKLTFGALANAMKLGTAGHYAASTTVHPTCKASDQALDGGTDTSTIIRANSHGTAGNSIAVSEASTVLVFDDANLIGGVERGEFNLELHEPSLPVSGSVDSDLSYLGYRYPVYYPRGHFDMGHCLPDVVAKNTYTVLISGVSSADLDDTYAEDYDGPILDVKVGSTSTSTHLAKAESQAYALPRGRRVYFGPFNNTIYEMQAVITVGLLG